MWIIPFAHGWTFINDEKIVMDFGLKVAINSLSDEKVRRIDSNHLCLQKDAQPFNQLGLQHLFTGFWFKPI
ncbi:MAG TPA: hypothetical protein ENK28_14780 [Aliiroseovarius sp.]|nr:hypothetical protein [Aliiroseovarius sp.]